MENPSKKSVCSLLWPQATMWFRQKHSILYVRIWIEKLIPLDKRREFELLIYGFSFMIASDKYV